MLHLYELRTNQKRASHTENTLQGFSSLTGTSETRTRDQSDRVLLCFQGTMLVELLCLLVFTLRLVHYAKVIPRDKFWKDPKNICIIVILMVGY